MNVMKEMSIWFIGDTIELFDRVLDDSEEHPQFSAVTTAKRIQLYIDYQNNSSDKGVTDFLRKSGYNAEDIDLFLKKYRRELSYYHGPKDNINL